ncbi:MAG: sensor histidine kinase, partial [Flavobacteriales bacterium]
GANRTAEIVKGLRVFSRLDEDALKLANLNECISSTLVILKSSVGPEVKINKDLDPDLPEINCFPGKLNQVFMNVITNAVQATADPLNKKDVKTVIITSSFNETHVVVSIKDNGIGIPDSVKAKIFDPFFTTKEVGDGTGLGLSIVLGIVNDHKGNMTVESTEGEGTEFLLTLPRSL